MTRAADDYEAIGKRMREIARAPEDVAKAAFCSVCYDAGWIPEWTAGGASSRVCPTCGNPEGKDCP